jgi:hypothetical protein
MIKGLIFDCDGTLADSMPLHWHAWRTVTERYNLRFPEDRFYALGGVPSRDIFKMLAEEQGVTLDNIKASHEKEEAYLPLMSQIEPIHAGLGRDAQDHRAGARATGHSPVVQSGRDQRMRGKPETGAGHFSRSGPPHRGGTEALPRLRRHRSGAGGHSGGGHGGGGCEEDAEDVIRET